MEEAIDAAIECVEDIPVIVEEPELTHEEIESEDGAHGESPYEIGTIQEEDEAAHHTDDHSNINATSSVEYSQAATDPTATSMTTSNMRPLVALSGEMSDWMECANADGDVYYYNVVTTKTTWDRPSELPPLLLLSDRQSHYPIGGVSGSNTPPIDGVDTFVKRVLDGTLRRLDPHTQLQLEEARRRHHELEELRDEEERMGAEHWIEMYDPTHDGFYFYGTRSGDMRWDRPDSYVMQVESDDVLRLVVRLQCVFRMKLARRKVFFMKLQRGLITVSGTEGIGEMGGEANDFANPWVEVYDPFHKVLYYYCSSTGETRWDPPEHFISATEDREMAAAIAIQSMSRSHVARRDVKKRKTTIRKKQRDFAMEEARKLREIRRKEYSAKTDGERESMCRREMLEEEMDQIRDGDLFWGMDKHDQEVVRQRMEEKLLADAEAFWQRVNMTLRHRVEMEMQRSQGEEDARHAREVVAEANEGNRMQAAEAEQCKLGDSFWGIQAEEKCETQAAHAMTVEEELSRSYNAKASTEDQFQEWEDEHARHSEDAKIHKVVNEEKNQRQYFKWFYHHCKTADDVLDYLWPTHERFDPTTVENFLKTYALDVDAVDENQPQTEAPHETPRSTPPPYVLDDTVLRERLETEYRYGNKSIFTIHDPSHARVSGRRGQYAISCVDTHAVFAKAVKQANAKPRSTSPTRPLPASSKTIPNDTEADDDERIRYGMFPALHYRHSNGPDPHLPARYNGVPYRPSEMIPTREILMGTHTKHAQLPSLALAYPQRDLSPKHAVHSKSATKISSSTSPQSKTRKSSALLLAMQGSNNNTVDPLSTSLGFASPFYRDVQAAQARNQIVRGEESQEERDAHNVNAKNQGLSDNHAVRFENEELPVVRDVFVAMDLDGSGTINKTEMVWAMQRDDDVHALARRSTLLRLLLKQPSQLDALFKHLQMNDSQHEEISWDVFRVFCEEMYISLMQQGILDSANGPLDGCSPTKNSRKKEFREQPSHSTPRIQMPGKESVYVETNEEQLIRRVFALCDQDGNGVLEVDELQQALYANSNPELQRLVHTSKALQPLLHQNTFIDAFRKFEPLDPRGISEEEFVVFCLEIAEIAKLNGML